MQPEIKTGRKLEFRYDPNTDQSERIDTVEGKSIITPIANDLPPIMDWRVDDSLPKGRLYDAFGNALPTHVAVANMLTGEIERFAMTSEGRVVGQDGLPMMVREHYKPPLRFEAYQPTSSPY